MNLAIHAAAGLVLFALVRRSLRLSLIRARFGAVATELAGWSALLSVVHPLQSESVTEVSQRVKSLVGLLYLLTWYACVRTTESDEQKGQGAGRRRWRVVAAGAFEAALRLRPNYEEAQKNLQLLRELAAKKAAPRE